MDIYYARWDISALELKHTWELVPFPLGKTHISSRWVYKIKFNSDGNIERFKARLVAKGYTQQEGIDYTQTFSPIVKMVTVRSVISLATIRNWLLFQLDVTCAFLHGDLEEEVYMSSPQEFHNQGKNRVCRLRKSLYCLKQASRQWNIKLSYSLQQLRFIQSPSNHSLFIKTRNNDVVWLLVYVDDILFRRNNASLIS